MSRLSKEREAEIRTGTTLHEYWLLAEIDALRRERDSKCSCGHPKVCWVRAFHGPREWGNLCVPENHTHEFCSICRERDEAIVGAYRAAAEIRIPAFAGTYGLADKEKQAILALPPQSVLDAVERDRREIVEMAIEAGYQHGLNIKWGWDADKRPTADDVLAKVGRGR